MAVNAALVAAKVAGKVTKGAAQLPARTVQATRSAGVSRSSGGDRLLAGLLAGLIALEVLSYLTGQYFSLDWQGLGQHPLTPPASADAYRPLYAGQVQQLAAIATGQAPATMAQQSQAAQLLHAQAPVLLA